MAIFEFPARFIRAKDGDSLVLLIDRGFNDASRKDFRLYGIDTPEIFSGPPIEREAGQRTKLFVIDWLDEADSQDADDPMFPLWARSLKQSKYGDYLVRIWRHDGEELADALLEARLARVYLGGAKQPWSNAELERMARYEG